ncbi:hypothetical protein [Anabaena sp. AL09]|nr:hypothetical protein [Anabaena sp. AL09]
MKVAQKTSSTTEFTNFYLYHIFACFWLGCQSNRNRRSQESGVRSQESGVRSQESGVRSQESGVRSQESGVRSQESG